jgi:hypothetical protein
MLDELSLRRLGQTREHTMPHPGQAKSGGAYLTTALSPTCVQLRFQDAENSAGDALYWPELLLRVAFGLQRGKKAERTGHSCNAAPSFICGDCVAIRCVNGWLADPKCTCSTALASYCRCRRPDLQIVVPCSMRRYLDAVQAAGEFWSKGSFGVILLKPWQASEIDAA